MIRRAGIRLLVAGLLLVCAAPAGAAEPPVEGLPERLPVPSPWAPLVSRDPGFAAVAVPGRVAYGEHQERLGDGLFVVDVEGEHYRRLPFTGDGPDPLVTLSTDGRWVAWTANPAQDSTPVHVLDLARNRLQDVRLPVLLPDRAVIRRLVLGQDPRQLLVLGDLTPAGEEAVGVLWRADLADGDAVEICRCVPRLAVDPTGRVWVRDGDPRVAERAGLPRFTTAHPDDALLLGGLDGVSADGRSYAEMVGDGRLRLVGPDGERVLPVPGSRLLGYEEDAVLVGSADSEPFRVFHVSTADGEVRPRVVADLSAGVSAPVVAADYGWEPPVPAPDVEVPWWSAERRSYLLWRSRPYLFGLAGAGLSVLAVVRLLVGRHLRRPARG